MTRHHRRPARHWHSHSHRSLSIERLESRQLLAASPDFLLIGDQGSGSFSDDTVKQINITSGSLVDTFVTEGSLIGPRGMVFHQGNLLVVNQNVNQPFNGEVLRFNGTTGVELSPLVPENSANAPFAPRGIVVKDNVLYVADFFGSSPGIAKYNATTGAFIGSLVPNGFSAPFNPRGVVFGPDGLLYVTVYSADENVVFSEDPSGYVLRFLDTTSGAFEVIASNNGDGVHQAGETADLHNAEGLVFGTDGLLYVTSFRFGASDNAILKFNPATKQQVGAIPIGSNLAAAILFGPNGRLYVPMTDGLDAGSVRVYDVSNPTSFKTLVPSGGALQMPWYVTFKFTDPATLAYINSPLQNPQEVTDVNAKDGTGYLDALLIMNRISRAVRAGLGNAVPVAESDRGPHYYDVDGNRVISFVDALRVMNFISRRNRAQLGTNEGESLLASPQDLSNERNTTALDNFAEPSDPTAIGTPFKKRLPAETQRSIEEAVNLIARDIVELPKEAHTSASEETPDAMSLVPTR